MFDLNEGERAPLFLAPTPKVQAEAQDALRRELAKFPPGIRDWMIERARFRGAPLTPGMIDRGKNVRALANGLGVAPEDLPADAVARYVAAGNALSNGSIGTYGKSLKSWRAHLAGKAAYLKPDAGVIVRDQDVHPMILEWSAAMADEGALTKRSARKYKLTMHRLFTMAGVTDPTAITRAHVSAFLGSKRRAAEAAGKAGISPSTHNHVKSVTASFASWAEIPDPAAKIKRENAGPSWTEPEQPIATAEEVASLLALAEADIASDNPAWQAEGYTLRVLIKACAYNALRIEEACHLAPADRWTNGKGQRRLTIPVSKTSKTARSIPLYPALDAELEGWGMPVCPPSWIRDPGDGRSPVFYSRLEAWATRHGVRIMWHGLRRFAASELYRRTKSIVLVQRICGHATPQMTLRYIGLSEDELYTDLAEAAASIVTDLSVPADVIDFGKARAIRRRRA